MTQRKTKVKVTKPDSLFLIYDYEGSYDDRPIVVISKENAINVLNELLEDNGDIDDIRIEEVEIVRRYRATLKVAELEEVPSY